MARLTGRRLSLALLVMALTVAMGLWLYSAFKRETAPIANMLQDIPKNVDVNVSAKGVSLSQGSGGRKEWELTASGADYEQGHGLVTVRDPALIYYPQGDNASQEPLRVAAPVGVVNQAGNTVRLDQGVRMDWGQLVALGRSLEYTGADKRLVLSGDVQAQRQDSRLTARQITFGLDIKVVTAEGEVRVETLTPEFGPKGDRQ